MRMTGVRPEVGARLIHLPLSEMQFFAFGGAHFWVFPCQLCQPFQPCQRGGMNQRTSYCNCRIAACPRGDYNDSLIRGT